MSKAKGVEILQVALAYVFQKTPYVFPIVGARKVDHIRGVAPAAGISLTEEEVERIKSSYSFDPGFPHTFLSGTLLSNEPPKGAYGPSDVWLTKALGAFDWVEPSQPITTQK